MSSEKSAWPGVSSRLTTASAVAELQRRRADGDAAGLLHVHPVGHGALAAGLAVDRAGLLDDPGVQRQRLGERRLAGVGVADDGEGAAADGLARPTAGSSDGGQDGGHGAQSRDAGRLTGGCRPRRRGAGRGQRGPGAGRGDGRVAAGRLVALGDAVLGARALGRAHARHRRCCRGGPAPGPAARPATPACPTPCAGVTGLASPSLPACCDGRVRRGPRACPASSSSVPRPCPGGLGATRLGSSRMTLTSTATDGFDALIGLELDLRRPATRSAPRWSSRRTCCSRTACCTAACCARSSRRSAASAAPPGSATAATSSARATTPTCCARRATATQLQAVATPVHRGRTQQLWTGRGPRRAGPAHRARAAAGGEPAGGQDRGRAARCAAGTQRVAGEQRHRTGRERAAERRRGTPLRAPAPSATAPDDREAARDADAEAGVEPAEALGARGRRRRAPRPGRRPR